MPETSYILGRGQRGIFGEIYFPKRVAYQAQIFKTLRDGYNEENVRQYLIDNATALLDELRDHFRLFDPRHYDRSKPRSSLPSIAEAVARFEQYQSPFQGWSMYTVDGVFFNEDDKLVDETTQVIRLLFRFSSSFTEHAIATKCRDVLRSITFWAISRRARLDNHRPWDQAELSQFVSEHKHWPTKKRAYVKQHFAAIVKEAAKWTDDIALFVFGYLVRQFSENVLFERMREDEIWTTSFFDLNINVVRRVDQPKPTNNKEP